MKLRLKKIGILTAATTYALYLGCAGILVGLALMSKAWYFILLTPIIYLIGGFIGGMIGAFIYNLIAKGTGGLELEFEKVN